MNDETFLANVTEHLAGLPNVVAVALGGSRAQATHRPDSDWDFAIYYRDRFEPQHLRDLGWAGQVSDLGGWGGGVFNGGAWLTIDGRRSDVHYRDLCLVEQQIVEATEGRFQIEPLLFHLAGIPTYLVVAEVALNRVLSGDLPEPDYPTELRRSAYREWWNRADLTFDYAFNNHARAGRLAACIGLLAQAAAQSAHAVLAGRGEWITNEKPLLARAGLTAVDGVLADVLPQPASLLAASESVRNLCANAIDAARPA